jgi:nucleoside-diphosphate-sugar epimerase
LITGGSGFIGTNLVEYLLAKDIPVTSLDLLPPRKRDHESVFQRVDLLDAGLAGVLDRFSPTHIVHLGARTDLHGEDLAAYSANTRGVQNLLNAIRSAPSVERVVFASSRMVFRTGHQPRAEEDYCPPNLYGQSKVIGERCVRDAQVNICWTIVRPTSIWGPWFDVPYKDFFVSVTKGRYVHPGRSQSHKSFGFVLNTVHQIEQILAAPRDSVHGKTLFLGDYPPLEVLAFANEIRRQVGKSPVHTAPMTLLKAAAFAGDFARKLGWHEPPLTSFRLSNLVTEMVYDDLAQLAEIVGQLPYDLDSGIRITLEWMEQCQPQADSTAVPAEILGR